MRIKFPLARGIHPPGRRWGASPGLFLSIPSRYPLILTETTAGGTWGVPGRPCLSSTGCPPHPPSALQPQELGQQTPFTDKAGAGRDFLVLQMGKLRSKVAGLAQGHTREEAETDTMLRGLQPHPAGAERTWRRGLELPVLMWRPLSVPEPGPPVLRGGGSE